MARRPSLPQSNDQMPPPSLKSVSGPGALPSTGCTQMFATRPLPTTYVPIRHAFRSRLQKPAAPITQKLMVRPARSSRDSAMRPHGTKGSKM